MNFDCDLDLQIIPSLVSADVRNTEFPLTPLYNAKFLTMDTSFFRLGDDVMNNMSVFNNLEHMEIIFGVDYEWKLLMKILENTPKLESLVITKDYLGSSNKNEDDQC
ncbi:putative F-box domain, FBD domain, leucine-rich repeat domain, L domain-containing protein [Senna tora]|uniref:Putative F-box domain, FBD domain, leucine-rich repeat domain, L domain-containing protein n=1 Tax=Senna tora TaxID=362788 RepID=A0A834WLY6_9FABA|nr:putative F-box domain, FBD domain, leucine-rich repeat domain, L domain-containing protein [Senna tora]